MFSTNKYTSWYYLIINHAQNNPPETGERHHIIPLSLGGEDEKSNIVLLSTRQHFICHKLLTHMTVGLARSKMILAFGYMTFTKNNRCLTRNSHIKSRDYELARRLCKQIIYTPERNAKISAARKGQTQIRTDKTKTLHKETLARKKELGIGLSELHKQAISRGLKGNTNGKGCNITKEHRRKIAIANSKHFIITFPDGKQEHVSNLSNWLRARGSNWFPRPRDTPIKRGQFKGFIFSELSS